MTQIIIFIGEYGDINMHADNPKISPIYVVREMLGLMSD